MINSIDLKIVPIILCGGQGKRLWPLSRPENPKQYLPLISENSMLQETILRLKELPNLESPVIVCNSEHRFLVAEQFKEINIDEPAILLEPLGRNTAPAISAAAFHVLDLHTNALLLVLPADHYIDDIDSFYEAINTAKNNALNNKLVTFGVKPKDANTEYGYIKSKDQFNDGAYSIDKFTEKPNFKTAQSFLKQGKYLWNSGMFMFKADILINELTKYSSIITRATKISVANALKDLDFIRLEKKAFSSCPSVSIDYALMEKSNNTVVVPLDAGWNDIGSWETLSKFGKKDSNGNIIKGDVITDNTSNTYINSSSNRNKVVTIGIDNLVIVNTHDVTLISTKEMSGDVKLIADNLEKDTKKFNRHVKVYRPWGWFEVLEIGKFFQIKKLHVKAKEKLSFQFHNKRAEFWAVVKGVASIRQEDKELNLSVGDSIHIAQGEKHSLANNTDEDLEVIEVQSGKYFGEDDIVRLEDIYGRIKK
jgi:mannose-1-phosphate guanylyltransferase/mannose-6-phosphate isomerase